MKIHKEQVKIWDLPLRLFHWFLVLGFVLAYLSAEVHMPDVHVLLGYGLIGLLVFRVFWGFAGNPYARFKSFLFAPHETLVYVKSLRAGNPAHYYGHNPAGALMVFGLLAILLAIVASGLMTLGVIDYEGPLVFLANVVGDDTAYFVRHAHDFCVDVALLLIPLHLLGVVAGSLQHKENLLRAMLTGKKYVVQSKQV